MPQTYTITPEGAVSISYNTLTSAPESLAPGIERAFGSSPDCLGILVVTDLPREYPAKRERLLRLAAAFAALPDEGKEIMNGKPDTLKGSYYANPVHDDPDVDPTERTAHPEYYGKNIWPAANESGVEGFEEAFKDLGRFVFGIGCQVAGACQSFVSQHLSDLSVSLEDLIRKGHTSKARLLHYFPPTPDNPLPAEDEPIDSWCGFHLDHSMLTGLCSAIYLQHGSSEPRMVPAPSAQSGLYIRTRGGDLVKVSIPANALAFQTGEALELATAGRLRATPHCVRVGAAPGAESVSRETFAVFMQPDTKQVLSANETFGDFSQRVFAEHYDASAPITA
ncbi:hypothetical protein FRC09_018544 [Ceratobasidium sp. 395]|nr:hypothetical protein FRC09_018544 [Ceratobasidium sp. 395]